MRYLLPMGLLVVAATAQAAPGRPACAPAASAEHDIVTTLQAIFAAAQADDLAAFHGVITSDFYMYDAGEKLVGDDIMKFIGQAHAAGKKYQWSVTEPAVHAACDTAWVTYVNRGFFEDDQGRHDLTWLESANLQYDGHRWRIRFVHSTRQKTA